MKAKQKLIPNSHKEEISIPKVKGHVTLTLTDIKTGKVETVADHNMQTDALNELFKNCGWLNRDNVDQNNLVEQLLGGVFLLDSEIDEDATIIHVPTGAKMTANGAVGYSDGGIAPSEMGVYKADECDYENTKGWLPDGAYRMIFEWDSSHGNGLIASVCATNKNYGAVGCGNALSLTRRESKINPVNLQGNITAYSGIEGYIFGVDLTNSILYALDVSDRATTGKGTLRKYRVPFSKVNLKGTTTAPFVLSETEVTLPTAMNSKTRLGCQAHDGKLLIWNYNEEGNPVWGDTFTQYLWTVTTAGVITEETILNTSGDELYGLGFPIFDGDYCFFARAWQTYGEYGKVWWRNDTRVIYILDRNSGVITKVDNSTVGAEAYGDDNNIGSLLFNCGWLLQSGNGNGRITTLGYNLGMVVDAEGMTVGSDVVYAAPTNSAYDTYGAQYAEGMEITSLVSGLIRCSNRIYKNDFIVVRDQCYIATIFNLSSPVTKTADKTMKLVYRFEFEEE